MYDFQCLIFLVLILKNMITCEDLYPDPEICFNKLFTNSEINTFADHNRQLRLNISWDKPLGNFDTFDMIVHTSDITCTNVPSSYDVNISSGFLIEPSLVMEYPVEKPSHGCKYQFTLNAFDNDNTCYSQMVQYVVPDCIDTVCHCDEGSPYKLSSIKELSKEIVEMVFVPTERMLNISLENVFNRIKYIKKGFSNHSIEISPYSLVFDQGRNSLTFPLVDVCEGCLYTFHVDLWLDGCTYHFDKEVEIKVSSAIFNQNRYIIYAVPVLGFVALLVIYLSVRRWNKLIIKIQKYFSFLPGVLETRNTPRVTLLNEVENVQYVPLDFIDPINNSMDHYEIPRNKIVIKNEIGGGSFGKVYKCEFYPMDSTKGIIAAAKMPIDNAPEEELADFLAEIKIMKKIVEKGGHKNVIKMFACVTLERPYVMVMELVPCGSLKSYLKNLRKEWDCRKRRTSRKVNATTRPRHFFPDNMIVEDYLSPTDIPEQQRDKNSLNLKYCSISFEDNSENSSSGSESYVTPDGLRTPSTPTTPLTPGVAVHIPSTIEEYQDGIQNIPIVKVIPTPRMTRIRRKSSSTQVKIPSEVKTKSTNVSRLNLPGPNSPESITSSGLPSCTETLLTPLDLESPVSEGKLIDPTTSIKPVLDSTDLQNFALQLANGMAFLESIDITHRDLAARNILITDQKTLKISDFGMARVGIYINNPQKRQPLRWMAPEAIEERKCDTKTDVWSFGVVLWEIGSLGAFPYGDLSNDMVPIHIRQGKRLERPEMCTDKLYSLMQQCWSKLPVERPTFNQIAKSLDENTGKIYVDFDHISPKYVFPPLQDKAGG